MTLAFLVHLSIRRDCHSRCGPRRGRCIVWTCGAIGSIEDGIAVRQGEWKIRVLGRKCAV